MKTQNKKTTSVLVAFHGDSELKAKYLARIQGHRKADQLASGFYWENRNGRMMGCAVGCILHSNNHANAEPEMGVPQTLTRLLDRLYESLWTGENEFAQALPERFVAAPKPGADLSLVWAKFALWMLTDEKHGVIAFTKHEPSRLAVQTVGALFQRWISGDKPKTSEWKSAENAARTAAYAAAVYAADAADAAVYAAVYAADAADAAVYAADAADAAVYAADAAAIYAADAAYAAAVYAADAAVYAAAADAADAAVRRNAIWQRARTAHCRVMADKLIELMEAA